MRILDGAVVLSPSDLTGFAACAHLTQLELAAARGEIARDPCGDPLLDVLSRRGMEHEEALLTKQVKDAGVTVVTIAGETRTRAGLEARAAETIAAMRQGAHVVYQAAFFDGRWSGYADFLERVPRPSDLGDWSYEVSDAKLARSVKAAALLQLSAYSEWVGRIQGVEPEQLHVLTGDGERHTFRVAAFSAYYRRLKADLEATVLGATTTKATYPDPVDHCFVCRWAEPCRTRRRADDHLSLVAGMSRQQTRHLVEAEIPSRRALAVATATDRPARIAEATFERLRAQAALQVKGKGCTPPLFELLPVVLPDRDNNDPDADTRPRGLPALPEPSPGDVFLDLEGDPYVDGGLEYLFGITEVVDGEKRYHAYWAHDRPAEKAAFEAVIDLITARRAEHPDMHVYHYAPYEPSAIRRLMGAHGTREAEVDVLLRGEVFVDLYQVVRHALRLSSESYSLKQVEKLYLTRADGAVMDAGSSIVAYEQWLLDQEPHQLDEIEAYNKDDCDSTLGLREWFEERRAEVEAAQGPIPRPVPPEHDTTELEERLTDVDALAVALTADVPVEPDPRTEEQQARWLLAQLLQWHRREEKPAWWRFFDRCHPDRTDDDMVDDPECIGGLDYQGVVEQVKQSLVHRYRFEPQDHKFDLDDKPIDPVTQKGAGTIVDIGDDFVDLSRWRKSDAPHPRALIPGGPYNTDDQKDALFEVGAWVRDRGVDAGGAYRAARDLLLGRGPRVIGGGSGPLVNAGERPLEAACRLVAQLDGGCLTIQGPPGAGKTYAGAHMVLALLDAGKRVGITAQSHTVISNFLEAVLDEAGKRTPPVVVSAIQKAGDDNHCSLDGVQQAWANADVLAALESGDALLAAGTSWLWCDPIMRAAVDVLFIDEAGQRSLADVMAAGVAAHNLVLLGDPQQLAQVSQGSHPEGAEKSALAHLLGDHATMPPELGLFLDTTYRMHPDVCAFVSEVAYEGKLESEPGLERQLVAGNDRLAGAGLRYVPVHHEGNSTSSPEEAEEVAQLIDLLLERGWTDEDGLEHMLTLDDVLIVAPYNAQVAELHRRLPDGAHVGTVDKFQGQEAPVTIYSMASSSADDAPRGMDFLYDLHRLNVAVSRARSISIVVCSSELQRVMCRTPDQMRLANAVCLFVEQTTPGGTHQGPGEPEHRS